MVLIAPSILSADFANLEAEIKKVENAGADWVHVDVMDGGFVPNITIGAPVVKTIKPITNLFVDVHLMIFDPHRHVEDFIKAGADLVTFHMEAYRLADSDSSRLEHELPDNNFITRFEAGKESQEDWEARGSEAKHYDIKAIQKTISLIRDAGAKVGISINPATPVSCLEEILADVNLVLLMSVNPGFGGQKFKEVVLEKISQVNAMADKLGLKIGTDLNAGEIAIEIDGGVAPGDIAYSLKSRGANVLVAGSAIYKAEDIPSAITQLKAPVNQEDLQPS